MRQAVARYALFFLLLGISLPALAFSILYLNNAGFMALKLNTLRIAIKQYGSEGLQRFGLTAFSYAVLLWLSLCLMEVVHFSFDSLLERLCAAVVVAGLASMALLYVLGLLGIYTAPLTWIAVVVGAVLMRRQHKPVWLRLTSAASSIRRNPLSEGTSLLLLLLVLFVPALFVFQLTAPTIPF